MAYSADDYVNRYYKRNPNIKHSKVDQKTLDWLNEELQKKYKTQKNNDDDSVFEAGWYGLKANTGSALQTISDAIIDSGKPKDVTMEDWKADIVKNSPFGWNPVVAASEFGAEIAKENAREYTPMSANSIAYGLGGVAPYAIGLGVTGAAAARTGNYKALGDIARTAAGQAVTKASGMPVFGATIARHSPAITKAAGVVAPAATVGAMQTVPEAMVERQSTMDEYVADAKKNNTYVKGQTEAEAREIANRVAADNVGLLTGTNTLEQALLARTPVGKLGRIAKQVGVGAGLNAAEEGAQTIFPLTEAGKSWSWNDPQLLESMVVGGLFGGAAQGVGAATGAYLDNKTASTEPIVKEKPATIKANTTSGNEDIDRIILEKSKQYGIDPDLVHAVIWKESRYNPKAVSPVGAVGLMQLMEGTAGDLGVTNREDIEQNIDGGIRYLKQMYEKNGGDWNAQDRETWEKALASYNGGYGNRNLTQTRLYAHDVWNKYNEFRGENADADITAMDVDTDDVSTIDTEDVERNAIEYAKYRIDKGDEDYTFLNDAIRRNDKQAVMDKYSAQDIQDWADHQVLNDQKLNEKYLKNRDANIKKILQNGEIKITNRQMLPFYRQNDTFKGGTIKKVEGGYLYTPPKDFMNRADVGRIAEENGITEMPVKESPQAQRDEMWGTKNDTLEQQLAKAHKRDEQKQLDEWAKEYAEEEELAGYEKEYARQDLATVLNNISAKKKGEQELLDQWAKEYETEEARVNQWVADEEAREQAEAQEKQALTQRMADTLNNLIATGREDTARRLLQVLNSPQVTDNAIANDEELARQMAEGRAQADQERRKEKYRAYQAEKEEKAREGLNQRLTNAIAGILENERNDLAGQMAEGRENAVQERQAREDLSQRLANAVAGILENERTTLANQMAEGREQAEKQRKQEAEANAPTEEVTAEPKQEKTEEKTEETVPKTETVEETPKEAAEEASQAEPQEVVSKTENTTEEAETEPQETVPEKENIAEEKESESEEKKDSLSSAKPKKGRWWRKEYPDKKSKTEFILEKSEVTEESATILDAISEDEEYLSRLIEEERASLADLKKQFGEDWLSGMREVRDETAKQYKALIEKYAKMMLDRVLTLKKDGWAESYIKWNIRMRLVEKLGQKKAEENLLECLRNEATYQLRNRPIDAKLGKPLIGEESCTKFAELEAVLDGYAYIQVEADKYHQLQSKGKTSVNIAETDIQGETENAKTQQRTSGRSEKKGERNNRVRDFKSKFPQREVKYTFVMDATDQSPVDLKNSLPKQSYVDQSFQKYMDGHYEVKFYNTLQKKDYNAITALGFKPKDEKSKFDKATAEQFPRIDTHNERLEEFYKNVREWCDKQGTGTIAEIVGESKAKWFATKRDTNHSPTGFLDFCNQAVLKGYKLPQKWVKLYKDTRKGREELYEAFEDIGKTTPQEAEIGENAKFQIAYHGTPHIFDEFSLSGVGTGEGATAHGWGLYFAQNKHIAQGYHERLTSAMGTLVKYDEKEDGKIPRLLHRYLRDIDKRTIPYIDTDPTVWPQRISRAISEMDKDISYLKNRTDSLKSLLEEIERDPQQSPDVFVKNMSDFPFVDVEYEYEYAKDYAKEEGREPTLADLSARLKREVSFWNLKKQEAQKEKELLESVDLSKVSIKGSLLEVDVPENDVLLDEQEYFGGQPDIVIDAVLEIIGDDYDTVFKKAIAKSDEFTQVRYPGKIETELTEQEIQKEIEEYRRAGLVWITREDVIEDHRDIERRLNESAEPYTLLDRLQEILEEEGEKEDYWDKRSYRDMRNFLQDVMERMGNISPLSYLSRYVSAHLALIYAKEHAKLVDLDGRDLYYEIAELMLLKNGNPEELASKALNKHGVKGITYESGIDGRCFVIFDDKAIEIKRKYDSAIKENKAEIKRTFDEIKAEVKKAFPNAKDMKYEGSDIVVSLPNGAKVRVRVKDKIIVNDRAKDSARQAHGVKDNQDVAIAGYWQKVSGSDIDGVIAISKDSTEGTAYHESLHMAMDLALTPKEKKALNDHYAKEAKASGKDVEEAIADGYAKWRKNRENAKFKGVFKKLHDIWHRLKAVFTGIENAHNVMRKIENGEVWERTKTEQTTQDSAPKYSVTSWAKNKFGKTKNITHELRVKDAITNLTGLKVAWGHTDKDIIYDEKQGVIRTRTAQDWGRVVPQVAEVVAKRLGMGIKTVDGKKTVDPAMKDYITEYIFTGALTKANTKEAKEFERVMQKNPKESEDILALKCEFERYGALTLSEQAMENLETDVKQNRTLKQKAIWTMMKLVDKYYPVRLMSMKMYKKFKELGEEMPRYLNPNTIVKNVSGATAQASMLIHLPQKRLSANASENKKLIMESIEATKDMVRREFPSVEESLIQKFKPLELILQEAGMYGDDTEAKKFQTYMVARRMLELHDREGIEEFPEVYNTPEKCRQIIAELENPAYIQAAEDLYNLQTLSLAIQVDCGTLSQTYFDRVTNENKNYIPLRRLIDDEKMTRNADSTKKVEGSARVVWAPFDQAMDNIANGFVKAQKNKAMAQVGQAAKLLGQAKTIEVVENNQPKSRNVVSYLVNGERVYIEAYPELAMSLAHITESRAATGAIKILSMANRVPRELLTTNNPEFALSAFFRDAMNFFLYEKGDPVDLFKGLKHTLLRDSVFQEYMTSGASQSVLTAADKDYFARNVTGSDKGSLSGFKNVIKALDKITSAPTEVMEQAVRVAAYEKTKNRVMKEELDNLEAKLRKSGMTEAQIQQAIQEYGMKDAIMTATVEARLAARDLMDFASRGEWGDALNSYSWFANAVIQGGYKSVRALNWKDPANKGKIQGRLLRLAGVCILQAALSAMGEDDDEIKGLSDADRYMYFHVRVGDSVLRIPKGDDLGIRTLTFWIDMAFNKREATLRRAMLPFENAFPNLLFMSALKPVVEVLANYSFFYNSEIVPKRLQNPALPEREHDAFTSRLAKEIGEAFHWSPKKVDYMMNAYFGGLGRAARGTIDWATEGKAPKEAAVVRRFVVPKGKTSVFVNDAYEYISEQDALYKDWQERRKTDSRAKADEKFDKAKYSRLKVDKEKLKALTEKIRKNRENPRITEAQREANHIAFTKARNNLAESIMFR